MTNEEASQKDYWNSRAKKFGDLSAPLIPGEQDIDFMRKQLVRGGHALILGVTPQLCSLALDLSDEVTAVDYAEDMIEALRQRGINYECMDWNEYFEQTTDKFDTIMTDGGLTCLEFPSSWRRLADNITSHLRQNGIFAVRAFINTDNPPRDDYENPNLTRFISSMARVDHNWMLKIETHDDYKDYEVRYAFPPEEVLLKTFGQLALKDKFTPDYEEGEHFASYSWQLSET